MAKIARDYGVCSRTGDYLFRPNGRVHLTKYSTDYNKKTEIWMKDGSKGTVIKVGDPEEDLVLVCWDKYGTSWMHSSKLRPEKPPGMCHLVWCGMEKEAPDYCQQDKDEDPEGCTCCPLCCTCGG